MKILIAVFVIAVAMLLEGFGIWMLLGIDTHEPTSRGKLFWLSVIAMTHWVGAMFYIAYRTLRPVGGPQRISQSSVDLLKKGLKPHTVRS